MNIWKYAPSPSNVTCKLKTKYYVNLKLWCDSTPIILPHMLKNYINMTKELLLLKQLFFKIKKNFVWKTIIGQNNSGRTTLGDAIQTITSLESNLWLQNCHCRPTDPPAWHFLICQQIVFFLLYKQNTIINITL